MKANVRKILHRCEVLTDWIVTTGSIALNTDEKEGVYAIKWDVGASPDYLYYTHSTSLDVSQYRYLKFYCKETVTPGKDIDFWIYSDAVNYSVWSDVPIDAAYGLVTIDMDNPSFSNGTGFDKETFWRFRLHAWHTGVAPTYYIDHVYVELDIESYLPLDCYIDSPRWRARFQTFWTRMSPKYESYFNRGDILHIQDDSSNTVFYGTIKTPKRVSPVRLEITAISEGFELVNKDIVFSDTSATTTSYLKQMIGHATKSQEGSLQATTIVYDYDVKKNYTTMIDHCRYTERGVFYREPGLDGGCYWNKDITDVASLVDTGETWTEATSGIKFMQKRPYDIGVTRVHVWGGNNSLGQVNYLATATSAENERGEWGIYRYSDFGLMNYTETKQIADNMLAMFKKDTTYYDFQARGKGFLQWCKRVNAKYNKKSILTTADDFMITKYRYYPKRDVYRPITLSDNIVFEDELKSIRKQLNRDDIINAEFLISSASASTADGTVVEGNRLDRTVWRVPEPLVWDFREGGGNTDFSTIGDVINTWYDLDFSSIVPVGTTMVKIRVMIDDGAAGSRISVRKNGQTSTSQQSQARTQVANQEIPFILDVGIDSDRKCEFMCNPKASDFTKIDFLIISYKI